MPVRGIAYAVRPNLRLPGVLTFHQLDLRRQQPIYSRAHHHTAPGALVRIDNAKVHYAANSVALIKRGGQKTPCIAVVGTLREIVQPKDAGRFPLNHWQLPDHVPALLDPRDHRCYTPFRFGAVRPGSPSVLRKLGDDVHLWRSKIWILG